MKERYQGYAFPVLAVMVLMVLLSTLLLSQELEFPEPSESTWHGKGLGRLVQPAPTVRMRDAKGGAASGPLIESLRVQVRLQAEPAREEARGPGEYEAFVSSTLTVRNVDAKADRLLLHMPLPAGISEVREVSLAVVNAQGQRSEATWSESSLEGLRWAGQVRPGESMTLVASYVLHGRDAFVYEPGEAGRAGQVRVEVQAPGARWLRVPAKALQPQEAYAERIVWSFDRLLTSQPLAVELPGVESASAEPPWWGSLAGLLAGGGLVGLFFSLPHWRVRRQAREKARREACERKARVAQVRRQLASTARELEECEALGQQAAELLEERKVQEPERGELNSLMAKVAAARTQWESLQDGPGTSKDPQLPHAWGREQEQSLCSVERRAGALLEALRVLQETLERRDSHCMACGVVVSAQFCSECGVPRTLQVTCEGCREVHHFPGHLLHVRWVDMPLHCRGCGGALVIAEPAQHLRLLPSPSSSSHRREREHHGGHRRLPRLSVAVLAGRQGGDS